MTRKEGDYLPRYAANMLPLRHQRGNSSPIFNYRYDRSREALHDLTRMGDPDEWEGYKLRYVNPVTGGYPMPSMGAFLQLLPKALPRVWRGAPTALSTTSLKGQGRSLSATKLFIFPQRHFCGADWHEVSFRSSEDTVLFSFRTSRFRKPRAVPRSTLLIREREHDQICIPAAGPGDSTRGGQ